MGSSTLLGLEHGTVALTNVDQVDDDLRELARLEVAEQVAGTFLENAELVEVAAPAGVGVDDLAAALDRMLADTPRAADHDRPRLWIDRSFAIRGAGTVVTGTLTGGSVSVDDELLLLPHDEPVRIRALQSLHRDHRLVEPGNRLAVNLIGVDHHRVARGDVLVRPGQWHRSRMVDADLRVLPAVDHPVSRRGAYAAYIGSGEHAAKVRILGDEVLQPGDEGLVRIHLPTALPLLPGDRYILRESGRGETVGGGRILDVDPRLPASRARPDRSVDRVIDERGWVEVDDLPRLTGERRPASVGSWVVSPSTLERTGEQLTEAVEAAGPLGLDLATLDERHRAVVETLEGIAVADGRAIAAGSADPLADHPYVAALEADPFTPPAPEGIDRGELRALVRRGLVVERDEVFFATAAVDAAARRVAAMLRQRPDGVTVSQIREELQTTRKYALPLLGQLDATGVTRRRGDVRIAGPRLPAPPAP